MAESTIMREAFTITELAGCAEREVRQRQGVYPRWVQAGRMTQQFADRQTALMHRSRASSARRPTPRARAEICFQECRRCSMAERVRHLKRGTEYEVLGVAELQVANAPVMEGSKLAVYRGDDGRLWTRELGEFRDGRFETITPTPNPEAIAQILEGAAEQAERDAVQQSSDERAVAQAERAAAYRRFAAALRELRGGEGRHG